MSSLRPFQQKKILVSERDMQFLAVFDYFSIEAIELKLDMASNPEKSQRVKMRNGQVNGVWCHLGFGRKVVTTLAAAHVLPFALLL